MVRPAINSHCLRASAIDRSGPTQLATQRLSTRSHGRTRPPERRTSACLAAIFSISAGWSVAETIDFNVEPFMWGGLWWLLEFRDHNSPGCRPRLSAPFCTGAPAVCPHSNPIQRR